MTLAGISTRGIGWPITLNVAGILQLRFRLRLHVQHVGRDQFAITEALAVRRDHRAVFGAQIFGRQIETPRGFRDQQLAHLRRRVLDRGAAVLHGMAAGGIAFIGGAAGIGGDDRQRLEGNVELFGGDLLEGGLETLAEFGLAGERGNAAVGVDANPGIEDMAPSRGCLEVSAPALRPARSDPARRRPTARS